MKRTLQTAPLMALLCTVVLIAGCSTGGIGGLQTVGTQFAPSQVSAGLYVLQWSQILWGLQARQTGTQSPVFGDPVFNDDGSISQTYTGPDGTEAVITQLLDGTVRLEITYPDGSTQTVLQGVSEFDGVSKTTIDWEVTDARMTVRYTTVVDDQGTIFDNSDDTAEMSGTSELPSGLTQEFEVQTAGGRSQLTSRQSDGSVFTLDTPLRAPNFSAPNFAQPTTGTYRFRGMTVAFTLASTAEVPGRWARMTSTAAGGISGEFALAADFAGTGRVMQDGQLVALPNWEPNGDADINWVSAQSSQTAPAGAVLDYITHRWQTLTALLAPAA